MTSEIITPENFLSALGTSLLEGNPDMMVELTNQALDAGLEPLIIINQGLVPGMNQVGYKFQIGEFFLPNLVVAARGMEQAMALLDPLLKKLQQEVIAKGTCVIGSVAGDIHEIGKSLVATMMSASGFQVFDLGIDVSTDAFVSKVKETGANILGLSALLTTTMTVQREVIKSLQEEGIREQVKVMVGGAPISQEWADSIGADGYAEDAVAAVNLAKNLVN